MTLARLLLRSLRFAWAILFSLAVPTPSVAYASSHAAGAISGVIVDERGNTLAGARIFVLGANKGATTGADGTFIIRDVPAGIYKVRARNLGVAPMERTVSVRPDCTTSISFTFEMSRDWRADSLALFGTWRWVRSAGGLLGANETPPPSGWWRLLHIERDGTYALWEHDSVGSYLLCKGAYKAFPCKGFIEHAPTAWACIELEGWWWKVDERQLVAFMGRDTIVTYPGGPTIVVSDALAHTYVRETVPTELPRAHDPSNERPFRLGNGLSGSYHVELPAQRWSLLGSFGRFYEWKDWQYPKEIRRSYRYAHDEIPSAAIADFDGDGVADAAIHGSTEGFRENRVICLLSNQGEWRPILILSEPTPFDSPDTTRFREPHTTLYLRLLHAGEPTKDLKGNPVSFPTNAILVARPDGYAIPYYFKNGEFVTGPRVESSRWRPQDPR